ncbi:flagellar hook assembly protein FlgD [Aquabacterium fontiphilum]|uniref:flagellar hook assembly protein FlgD n=1 Tax=Aquabacterium fontiphilum TaxID=450365 RepID=UPI0013767A1E|nr:flagellar hook capping FlgD N-terminal domain-containing protein [Aquabacterium fontiphilum]NBD21419.1 flagellar hook assembly protein FlgD [Aquabacterium fontiphilum]
MTTITGTSATSGSASPVQLTSAAEMSDRFLKLLVTQLKNQDPLNPMENAEMTSQMAQINTVAGIDKLNTTMQAMNAGFGQMQMLQGASLVGRSVLLDGNNLIVGNDGKAYGGYELSSAASGVRIEVVNAAGVVVDTINQTDKATGRQGFEWKAPEGMSTNGLTFRVTANTGGTTVAAKPLTFDSVTAINTTGGTLTLELSSGKQMPYNQVRAIS